MSKRERREDNGSLLTSWLVTHASCRLGCELLQRLQDYYGQSHLDHTWLLCNIMHSLRGITPIMHLGQPLRHTRVAVCFRQTALLKIEKDTIIGKKSKIFEYVYQFTWSYFIKLLCHEKQRFDFQTIPIFKINTNNLQLLLNIVFRLIYSEPFHIVVPWSNDLSRSTKIKSTTGLALASPVAVELTNY